VSRLPRQNCHKTSDHVHSNNTDGDGAERDCICEAQNATPFTSCNECTLQYPEYFVDDDDDDDDDDNEVNIWFNRCNFAAGGAVTSAPSSTGTVVPVSTSVSVSCDDDDDDDSEHALDPPRHTDY
jgi:hypothetical protein